MIDVIEKDGSIVFTARVIPRASRSEIGGEMDGAVKVRVSSPPVDGAANTEIVKLFAKALRVPRSAVAIVAGAASRTKRIRVDGVTAEQLRNALG